MRMYHLYTAHTEQYSYIQGEIKENPLKKKKKKKSKLK